MHVNFAKEKPGRRVQEDQEEISPNHVQTFLLALYYEEGEMF